MARAGYELANQRTRVALSEQSCYLGITKPRDPKMSTDSNEAHNIFISYSHDDADAAQSVAKHCRQIGAEPWLYSEQLLIGDKLNEKLEEAIRNCDVAIVLISATTLSQSELLRKEWSAICETKWSRPEMRVIPIFLDRSELPPFLSGFKALDGSNEEKLYKCVSRIPSYPAVQALTKASSLSEQDREKLQKRFRQLLQVLSKESASPEDVPPPRTCP
jgi:hypothetical protein